MDLAAMRTQVRDIIGELVADFWTNAELARYLTEAQFRFLGEATWPWLLTEATASLAAGNPDLELPEGIDATKAVNISLTKEGDVRMYQPKRVSPAKGFELRGMYSSTTTSSYPLWFYVTSVSDQGGAGNYTTVVKFIPTPVSVVDIDYQYFRQVDDLIADADIPDLPVEYHKSLVHYAAGTAWLKELNGGTKAGEQFEMYSSVVEQAKREFFAEPDDTPVVVGMDEPQYSTRYHPSDPWLLRIPETLGP